MKRRTFLTSMGLGWLASASPALIGAAIAWDRPQMQPQPLSQGQQKAVEFYVAPNGNDTWLGQLANPNQAKTDGPFATLQRARDAIRELTRQQGGSLKQPVTVLVRGGTYYLTEPLWFFRQDSGTANWPIAYAAYANEKPVISGGRRITGWQAVTVDGKQLWAAEIPEVREGKWFFRQLWVNGQRRDRARHPNKGYLKVAEVPDANPKTPWNEGQTRFRFSDGDLQAWRTIADAEIVVMTNWIESRLPVTKLDETQRLVSFGKKSSHRVKPGDLYYIEHALEILDAPGEWYLERKTGKVYYWPMPDEDLSSAEIIAPVLSQLIIFRGSAVSSQFVDYLLFRGLTFSHAEWYYPEDSQNSFAGQGAFRVPGAVYGNAVRHCAFIECTFAHLGNYALELIDGCQNNLISSCEIFDVGAGAIKIRPAVGGNKAALTHSNEITKCHIYNGGRIFHGAVGIWIGQSYNNRVSENHIHDFYYTAISVGETWGYKQTLAKSNIVELNHIHHIGLLSDGDGPLLNDKGAIYILGVQPGTAIRSNFIHDIQAFNYGAWGIYLDEGSSQILIENNVVYRTRDGAFHLHYGRENIIRNNIFAFGSIAQIRRSRSEPHLSFTFEQNIIYWNEGKLLEGSWDDDNFAFDRNLYWRVGAEEIRFGKLSWKQWHDKGMDKRSLIADPLFVAPEKGDFRLKANSPAFQLGFKPIPREVVVSQ